MTNISPPVAKVVSVCSSKDIDVWSVACKHVIQYIDASEYVVVVPDHEVTLFEAITCSPYQVIPESFYVSDLKTRLKKLLPVENHDRIGWYLQQFIKISATKKIQSDGNPDALAIIWDADTIPLRKLNFVDEDGRVLYYSGTESHSPYFQFIKRVFPWAHRQQFSFIAQCFPAKISWVQDFCIELESDGRDWIDSIIFHLDESQRAGFSEYESLGTYIWDKYPGEVSLNKGSWERGGRRLVGNPLTLNELEFSGLSKVFDYISFEAWDAGKGMRSWMKTHWNRLKFYCIGLEYKKQ